MKCGNLKRMATTNRYAETQVRALPGNTGQSVTLPKGQAVYIHGYYEDYALVETLSAIVGFVEKAKVGYGVGVGNPWPGTTYLLPANDGTTSEEAAFDLTRTSGDPPYLVPNSVIGNDAHVGNHPKAKRLFNAGKTEYLVYYVALQWQIPPSQRPGNTPVPWAYDSANVLGDLPRMVKVTRTDNPAKAVYVSVLEAGPGVGEGNGELRNSGLSPAAMRALGFSGTLNPQNYGEPGWLTYEWAPGAPPGPAN